MTKLADVLKKNKLDARRLIATSKKAEGLRPEDRALKMLKSKAKGGDEAAKTATAEAKKPRSGRAVSKPTLDAALAGKAITGTAKTRITRAVNALLVAKKKAEVTMRDLF
ncbi:MAG: hypothetical protein IPK60_17275 [Sandaracinaceae bacterium]|nr:hypothetical protein [Sandaracinaceae bacterium]